MGEPAISSQQAQLTDDSTSGLATYKNYVVGSSASYFDLFVYELITTVGINFSGLLGFGFRRILYPLLFAACGKRPAIGRSVSIRGAKTISLGNKVLVDDFAVLDARGARAGIVLGDYASVGRFTTIAAKGGTIRLEKGANIGSYCRIATQSSVTIGEGTLVAAYSYIGPGNHKVSDDSKPLITQGMDIKGGVKIGAGAWIGAHTTIMDGVTIGDRAVIGAHSFVKDDIPAGVTVVGCPAKPVSK